jgi:hypothetical protein
VYILFTLTSSNSDSNGNDGNRNERTKRREAMRKYGFATISLGVAISLAILLCAPAHAQTVKTEGLIYMHLT